MDSGAFRLSDREAIAAGLQSIQMGAREILGQDRFSDRAMKATYERFAAYTSADMRATMSKLFVFESLVRSCLDAILIPDTPGSGLNSN